MFTDLGLDSLNLIQWGGIKWDLLTEKRIKDDIFLDSHGYKVYSQNDEDGIIQEIFRRIGTSNKIFVEIGVENGLECNTHYLLFLGWKGMWIEASETHVNTIKRKFNYVVNNDILKVVNAFISKDNINDLLVDLPYEIDLLSIDIDGNDYYIFDSLSKVNPRVVIMEYNGKFPPDCDWCMPYCKDYIWNGTDRHGASLKSLVNLATKKGYVLVGTNLNGVNAFFVRSDCVENLFPFSHTPENLYNPLRLNIKFQAGHPSNTCLVNPNLQMEYLFDNIEDSYVAISGFYPKEFHEDRKTYHQWMSQKKSTAFMRIDKATTAEMFIEIQYASVDFMNNGNSNLKIYINESLCYSISELKEFDIIDVPLNTTLPIVKIEFEISRLWKPSEVLGSNDCRELGIAIHGINLKNL